MKVLYLATAAHPVLPGAEATLRDIRALRARFGGSVRNLYPFRKRVVWWPRLLYGLAGAGKLAEEAASHDLVHLFHAAPYGFPVLRRFSRPVVYTVVAGLDPKGVPGATGALSQVKALVVSNRRDKTLLEEAGHRSVTVVRPGVVTSAFTVQPCPPGASIRVLLGSAPWTKSQFKSKGVLTALDAASRMPTLSPVFLWRGLLFEELRRQIEARGIAGRVEIVTGKTDINALLGTVSAAAVLSDDPSLVKGYPNSLLESLAAGKPVIVSRSLPMSDYVEEKKCGVVVDDLSGKAFHQAVRKLAERYAFFQEGALRAGREGFPMDGMLDSYERIYRTTLAAEKGLADDLMPHDKGGITSGAPSGGAPGEGISP